MSQGRLERVSLPNFRSPEWPLPSSNISEAVSCKLFQEVQRDLKPNNATRFVKVKVSMPIDVFIDLFATADIELRKLAMLGYG